jgi:hypothetical protein
MEAKHTIDVKDNNHWYLQDNIKLHGIQSMASKMPITYTKVRTDHWDTWAYKFILSEVRRAEMYSHVNIFILLMIW